MTSLLSTTTTSPKTTACSFEQVVYYPRAVPFLLDFLSRRGKNASILLVFACECEQFKRFVGNPREINAFGRRLMDTYFAENQEFKVAGEAEHNRLRQRLAAHPQRFKLDMFTAAQRVALSTIYSEHFEAFLASSVYEGMVQELFSDFRSLGLLDLLRDNRRINALHDFLLVEYPENVTTLRFCLELRNNYRPLVAAALAPIIDADKAKGVARKSGQAKNLVQAAKKIIVGYLIPTAIPKGSAMTLTHAAEVEGILQDLERKLEIVVAHADETLASLGELVASSSASATTSGTTTTTTTTTAGHGSSSTSGPLASTSSSSLMAAATSSSMLKSLARGAGGLGTGDKSSLSAESAAQAASLESCSRELDEVIRALADCFHPVEEDALAWLERTAIVKAQRSDIFVSLMHEGGGGGASDVNGDLLEQTSLPVSFLRLTQREEAERRDLCVSSVTLSADSARRNQDLEKYARGPFLAGVSSSLDLPIAPPRNVEEVALLTVKNVCSGDPLVDDTGACVTGMSKGCRFATTLTKRVMITVTTSSSPRLSSSLSDHPTGDSSTSTATTTLSSPHHSGSTTTTTTTARQHSGSMIGTSSSTTTTTTASAGAAPTPARPAEKAASLAGILASEADTINRARARMANTAGVSLETLVNTELHAYCFPLGLAAVEVDAIATAASADAKFAHCFVLPCRRLNHQWGEACSCAYGVCITEMVLRKNASLADARHVSTVSSSAAASSVVASAAGAALDALTATTAALTHNSAASAAMTTTTTSLSSTAAGKRSRAARMYCEYAITLQKVPGLGLGLNLALNRDGSVIVSRFLSEAGIPSPAAASGRVAIDDDLISVNGINVHGRRFDDIVAQIRNSQSEVALKFSRGNFLESAATTAGGARQSDKSAAVSSTASSNGFTVRVPETVCYLSPVPCFRYMMGGDSTARALSLRHDLLRWFSVTTVVDLLSCLLLERRVLLVSDHPDRIAPAFEALRTLLWPFTWKHEWAALLPEAHVDWFAARVGSTKPYFAGVCTVDVVPPSLEKFIPRRQGRLVLREEAWCAAEKDAAWPSERVFQPGAIRLGLMTLLERETVVADLDADRLCRFKPTSHAFPPEIREFLVREFNRALGWGGLGLAEREEKSWAKRQGEASRGRGSSKDDAIKFIKEGREEEQQQQQQQEPAFELTTETAERRSASANHNQVISEESLVLRSDSADLEEGFAIERKEEEEESARLEAERAEEETEDRAIRDVTLQAYSRLIGRAGREFTLSRRENVVAFHRAEFLRQSPQSYKEFLESFTVTEIFQQHIKMGWEF